tara:strand:+ start:1077 stop:1694 length:618 start_codon:yes stop_codon:yes gene_type:complete
MKSILKKIKADLSGFILNKIWDYCWIIKSFLATKIQIFNLLISKIDFGDKISFYGFGTFKRAPLSTIKIGDKCTFRSKSDSNLIGINRRCMVSTLSNNALIEIGNNCGFSGTVIGAFTKIKIGNNVKCGANTLITDSDWHLDDYRSGNPKPVIIGDNVWLGVNVTVLKGVTIGENSLIGAGSVVTKDIPPNTIAVGNPCKIIRKI